MRNYRCDVPRVEFAADSVLSKADTFDVGVDDDVGTGAFIAGSQRCESAQMPAVVAKGAMAGGRRRWKSARECYHKNHRTKTISHSFGVFSIKEAAAGAEVNARVSTYWDSACSFSR